MDTNKILENLNKKQIEAVQAIDGPVLILAGAGSGKTKALTHRIAYMIASGIKPHNILAVTFTNKAAGEMKNRVSALLKTIDQSLHTLPWMGTFHSICMRILRQEIEALGYGKNFLIYDMGDQLSLMKSAMHDLNIDTKKHNPKAMLGKISKLKSELTGPSELAERAQERGEKMLVPIYLGYQKALQKNNALDFDDLITMTVELFQKSPQTLNRYQDTFKYILVDEYQDTNHAQYAFINLLAKKHRNLFVIGDDYQCFIPGTKIQTEKGLKKIEKIEVGDRILSPAGRGKSCLSIVKEVKKFNYSGEIFEIKTKRGHTIKATPNHILFGKLLPSNFHMTYLMYSNKHGYRIGTTTGIRSSGRKPALGLDVRANQERADKMWILKVLPSSSEARFWEAQFAFKYGIPTTIFNSEGKNFHISQEQIDNLYKIIPTTERVKTLMDDHYIFSAYPHHRPQGTIKYKTKRITVNLTYFAHNSSSRMKSPLRAACVSINSGDEETRTKLLDAGFKIRRGKANTWRIENAFRDYADAETFANKISSITGLEISKKALITDLNFQFLPASHITPRMTVPVPPVQTPNPEATTASAATPSQSLWR